MSLSFPYKFGGGNLTEQQKQGLWKILVPLLLFALIAVLVVFVRYVDRVRPTYNEVGMYHPPDYRPKPLPEETPATVPSPGLKHNVKTTSGNSAPASKAIPVPAPVVAKAHAVEVSTAAIRKPEGNSVHKELGTPSSASALPAKQQEKAKIHPAPIMAGGAYTLLIGEFSGSQAAADLRTKLQKLGITRVHEEKISKIGTMHRLFLANYEIRQTAETELQKLRQKSASAFMSNEKGTYAVYAGSYLQEKRAVAEQQRLAGENIKLSIQTEPVTITLTRVTAGSFSGSTPAQKKADFLEKHGIHAQVIKAAKSVPRGVSPTGS